MIAPLPVTLEGHGGPLVTLETLRDWLHICGTVTVSIRPVIDLNADLTSTARFAPPRIREQVGLRDRTCAAPYCTRPARHLDLDHLDPWTDTDHPSIPARRIHPAAHPIRATHPARETIRPAQTISPPYAAITTGRRP